jgi:hypothetical protein
MRLVDSGSLSFLFLLLDLDIFESYSLLLVEVFILSPMNMPRTTASFTLMCLYSFHLMCMPFKNSSKIFNFSEYGLLRSEDRQYRTLNRTLRSRIRSTGHVTGMDAGAFCGPSGKMSGRPDPTPGGPVQEPVLPVGRPEHGNWAISLAQSVPLQP